MVSTPKKTQRIKIALLIWSFVISIPEIMFIYAFLFKGEHFDNVLISIIFITCSAITILSWIIVILFKYKKYSLSGVLSVIIGLFSFPLGLILIFIGFKILSLAD